MYLDKAAVIKSGLEEHPALFLFATSVLPGKELPKINTAQERAGPEATIRSPPAPSPRRNIIEQASGSGSVPQPASSSGSVPQVPNAEPKAAQIVEPPPKRMKSPPNAMPKDKQAEEIKERSRAKSPREAPAQAKAEPSTNMKDRSAKVNIEHDYEIGSGGVAPQLVEKKA